jgi:hypothetical protein
MSENLEHRIAVALSDAAVTSAALSELIQETDAAIVTADTIAEEERAKAMDPARSPDPKAARAAMEDAQFAANRLRTLQPRLRHRHEEIARAERKAEWVAAYDEIKPEHDALVAELRALYPRLERELVDLLTRIRAFDERAKAVMAAKPSLATGEQPDGRTLPPVEFAARGWDLPYGCPAENTLDRGVILLDFYGGKRIWPPHEVPLAARVAGLRWL